MKKWVPDNQILNTFLEETREYKGKGKIINIRYIENITKVEIRIEKDDNALKNYVFD
ncbi:hypothetical protein D3C85_84660 [compost metagenome]